MFSKPGSQVGSKLFSTVLRVDNEDPGVDWHGFRVGGIERLWMDERVKTATALCFGGGTSSSRFLFEILPDLFPYDYLSVVEIGVWSKFLDERNKEK